VTFVLGKSRSGEGEGGGDEDEFHCGLLRARRASGAAAVQQEIRPVSAHPSGRAEQRRGRIGWTRIPLQPEAVMHVQQMISTLQ
jgi:hypothetical protein